MKIGMVYTGTTPELIEFVEREVKKEIGADAVLMNYADATILGEAREHGYVTGKAAARLYALYMQAIAADADAILNLCSSVGETADAIQNAADYMGVPVVRVDEEMCREAVRKGKTIAALATLSTTLEPTKNTLRRVAREMGREITLLDGLVDAFGADQEVFKSLLVSKAKEFIGKADIILLCQGSMAYAETVIEQAVNIPTLSSPRFGAAALKQALLRKGVL